MNNKLPFFQNSKKYHKTYTEYKKIASNVHIVIHQIKWIFTHIH